ncbi:histone H2A%2C sperm-like [Scomber scombrus]|uniref:Histone H2A, sperm-like n=1 Tax=Scomber scombrus TaxID=13677 RepID=A0AAV1NVQ7_SCOSC
MSGLVGRKLCQSQNPQFPGLPEKNLTFPVGRIHRLLRKGQYTLTVLEYLRAEMLVLSGNASHDNKKRCIAPVHILLALKNDEELNKLLAGVTISEGRVIPNIQASIFPKRTKALKDDSPAKDVEPQEFENIYFTIKQFL